jgi:chaperonin cofactor prefoldin
MSNQLVAQYARLCQELGDLVYKKTQIESRIEDINVELKGLNFVDALTKQAESKNDNA